LAAKIRWLPGKRSKSKTANGEELILKGIKILDESKLKALSAPGYHYLGELYADSGQNDKALETLKTAKRLFREMGMNYWLNKTQEVVESSQT